MAATIVHALGADAPLTDLAADAKRAGSNRLCQLVGKCRRLRSNGWLDYIDTYKGHATTQPVDIDEVERKTSELEKQIDALRAQSGLNN
jgi:hypothetical protein